MRLHNCLCLTMTLAFSKVTAISAEEKVGVEPNQQSDLSTIELADDSVSGFFDGTSVTIKPRSYYLDRDRDTNPDTAGLALGGSIEYRSGWWQDRVRAAATLYTSQKLYGPRDKDGTQLFKPGPESFSVLGEANLTYRFTENQGVRLGRQRLEMPYLGSHDIRMVPNTFEGLIIGNRTSPTGFAYMAGYIDKIKRKNDDTFISMSEAAGVNGEDEGTGFAGARYVTESKTTIGVVYQRSFETFDTLFAKLEHPFTISEHSSLKSFLQYTDQRSRGDELIGAFDTSLISAKLELSSGALNWRVGFSRTGNERGIQKPYGNPANYLSVIVEDFDRAGEDAWLAGFSYDFKQVGIGDLSLFANVVSGNTNDHGLNASADQTEYNLTIDYRVKHGWAERVWLRTRLAYVDQDGGFPGSNDFLDFRIIINYNYDVI